MARDVIDAVLGPAARQGSPQPDRGAGGWSAPPRWPAGAHRRRAGHDPGRRRGGTAGRATAGRSARDGSASRRRPRWGTRPAGRWSRADRSSRPRSPGPPATSLRLARRRPGPPDASRPGAARPGGRRSPRGWRDPRWGAGLVRRRPGLEVSATWRSARASTRSPPGAPETAAEPAVVPLRRLSRSACCDDARDGKKVGLCKRQIERVPSRWKSPRKRPWPRT